MRPDVGIGTHEDPQAALVGADPTDGLGALAGPLEAEAAIVVPDHERLWQVGRQVLRDRDGARARPSAAVGVEKVLWVLKCITSKPASPGRNRPAHRVHVGTVHIGERNRCVGPSSTSTMRRSNRPRVEGW